jgi:enamine deaminase RidA (YjgF/YER057c/UK114 family)
MGDRSMPRVLGGCARVTAFARNGVSDLAVEVFGDAGRHARTTVGVSTLPMGIAVEVEGAFWIA